MWEKPEKPLLAVSPAVGNVYTVGGGGGGYEGRCIVRFSDVHSQKGLRLKRNDSIRFY